VLYDIRHNTTFEYEDTVSTAQHLLHLQPRNSDTQRRVMFTLTLEPQPPQWEERSDYFGNTVHHLSLQEPHDRFVVESRSRIDVRPAATPDLAASSPWESLTLAAGTIPLPASEFSFSSPLIEVGSPLASYALRSFTPGRPVLDAAMDLTTRIFREFEYKGGVSDVSTPVLKVLSMRQGVCQDFAHLQIACLRSIGLAARYISGYLLTHPPEGQEKLVGSDASHAWLAVWSGERWIEFDPTNNLIPVAEHITLAWGRDYSDVSPTTGFIVGGGGHNVTVAVDVTPVPDAGT